MGKILVSVFLAMLPLVALAQDMPLGHDAMSHDALITNDTVAGDLGVVRDMGHAAISEAPAVPAKPLDPIAWLEEHAAW